MAHGMDKLMFPLDAFPSRTTYLYNPNKPRMIPTVLPPEEWRAMFEKGIVENPLRPQSMIVMDILQKNLEMDDSTTTQELIGRLSFARNALTKSPSAGCCVVSSGELFTRLITLHAAEIESAKSIDEVKRILVNRGANLIKTCDNSPVAISAQASSIFRGYALAPPCPYTICVNGWNGPIFQTLVDGHKIYPNFNVLVAECQPLRHGIQMGKKLREAGISCEVFADSALAAAVLSSTSVMIGVEGVCSDGNLIVEASSATMFNTALHYEREVHVFSEFYKLANSGSEHVKTTTLEDACFDLSSPGADGKYNLKTSNNITFTHKIPPNHYQRVFSDVGPLCSASIYENFVVVFT